MDFIRYHRNDLPDRALNSGLFQIVLGALMVFVATSSTNMLLKSLVISTFANSIYVMLEMYFDMRIHQWFWAIKVSMNKTKFTLYTAILILVLIYSISLL
jgi:hypothetical protein